MKKSSLFSAIFCIIAFLTCISCGYCLSTILVSTNLLSTTVSSDNFTIFALSTQKSKNEENLISLKAELQSQNGGGFIYQKDGEFFLIASAYENSTDAEKVKINLKNQNLDCEIIKIIINSCKIEGNFSNEEKIILQNALKCKSQIFKSLYDVAVSLDTKIYDEKKAKLECNNIFSSLIETKTNLETFFKSTSNEINLLKNEIQSYYNLLNDLILENFDSKAQTFSSLIKLTYLKILLK